MATAVGQRTWADIAKTPAIIAKNKTPETPNEEDPMVLPRVAAKGPVPKPFSSSIFDEFVASLETPSPADIQEEKDMAQMIKANSQALPRGWVHLKA